MIIPVILSADIIKISISRREKSRQSRKWKCQPIWLRNAFCCFLLPLLFCFALDCFWLLLLLLGVVACCCVLLLSLQRFLFCLVQKNSFSARFFHFGPKGSSTSHRRSFQPRSLLSSRYDNWWHQINGTETALYSLANRIWSSARQLPWKSACISVAKGNLPSWWP